MEATQAEQHYLLTSDNMKPRWILIEYWVVGRLCFRVFFPPFFTWVLTVRALIQTLSVTERIKANGLKVGVSSVSPHTHTPASPLIKSLRENYSSRPFSRLSQGKEICIWIQLGWMPPECPKPKQKVLIFTFCSKGLTLGSRQISGRFVFVNNVHSVTFQPEMTV